MSGIHKIYLAILTLLIIVTTGILAWMGYSYYNLPLEIRPTHEEIHQLLKPSGILGHGYGVVGTACILLGIILYMLRKRMRSLARFGELKYWLEFHIFLCTLGPVLILYHTSFKFGGLVAISFWSMVAVFLSGIVGRFIYLQIPRSIEGRELTLSEVRDLKTNIGSVLSGNYKMDEESTNVIIESTKKKVELHVNNIFLRMLKRSMNDRKTIYRVKSVLKSNQLARTESKKIVKLVRHEISLNRRIDNLQSMQRLFNYWHVAHFPFAIVMLVIMAIHVVVAILFGAHWIFKG
ncbi:MAG: hypothetical protein NTW10_05945 [Bacteroidetes bacterium]|nr:hypothetical protein [Bacteroidota bacterium]